MIIWNLIILPVIVAAHPIEEVLKDPKDLALSKALSWLLRHGAVAEGLDISKDGYIQLRDVLKHRLFTRRYTIDDVRRIASIDKYRFNLQKNPLSGNLEIRANHGHTIDLQKGSSNLLENQLHKSGKILNEHRQQQYNRIPVVDTFAAPHSDNSDDRSFSESYITYTELTRILSWMLRRGTKRAGLTKSPDGFIPVDELLEHNYLKGKCNIEDIITVVDNEPEVYELKKNPDTKLLEIRVNVDYTVKKLNKVELTKIPHSVYLPLPYIIRGVNECEWEEVNNIGGIRSKSEDGYIYFSPYEPADSYATKGVTKHDDIYIYVGVDAAIEDGIEFYKTRTDEIITKGNEDGIVSNDYYVKVVERKSGDLLFNNGNYS